MGRQVTQTAEAEQSSERIERRRLRFDRVRHYGAQILAGTVIVTTTLYFAYAPEIVASDGKAEAGKELKAPELEETTTTLLPKNTEPPELPPYEEQPAILDTYHQGVIELQQATIRALVAVIGGQTSLRQNGQQRP